jgi:hypothetical protein
VTFDTLGFVFRAASLPARIPARELIAAVATCAVSAACTGSPQAPDRTVCTAQFVYGLAVTVKDEATGQLVCDAQVSAVSSNYRETLLMFGPPGTCSYAGAGERAGVYEVSASKAGYAAATTSNVRVDADACHVIPTRVTLELKR